MTEYAGDIRTALEIYIKNNDSVGLKDICDLGLILTDAYKKKLVSYEELRRIKNTIRK